MKFFVVDDSWADDIVFLSDNSFMPPSVSNFLVLQSVVYDLEAVLCRSRPRVRGVP